MLAGLLGTLGGFAPAAAAAAPTTVSCGSTINASGTYVLAADCSGVGIEITASDVTLKLNGQTMTGCSSCGSGVFVFDVGAISGVTIKGPGKIVGYNAGVQFGVDRGGVSGSSVSGLTVTSNADGILLDGGSGNTVSGIAANNNINAGIDLIQSNHNTVSGNTANHSSADGILLRGGSGNTVSGNTANNNNGDGIHLVTGATGNTVSGNTAQGNSTFDLFDENGCGSNTWTGNTFKTANLTCIL